MTRFAFRICAIRNPEIHILNPLPLRSQSLAASVHQSTSPSHASFHEEEVESANGEVD